MKNNTMLISTLSIEGEESWGAKAMFASQHAGCPSTQGGTLRRFHVELVGSHLHAVMLW